MVTHLTTNLPVSCLNMAERTGSLVPMSLWLYVEGWSHVGVMYRLMCCGQTGGLLCFLIPTYVTASLQSRTTCFDRQNFVCVSWIRDIYDGDSNEM